MAVSTFAELQTAVGAWLERAGDSDVTSNVTDFIKLGEAELNTELMGLRKTTVDNSSLTGTTSSRNISISSLAFLAPVALILTTDSEEKWLQPYVAGSRRRGTTNGYPTAWTINGDNIELDRPCDQAHTFVFRYHQFLDIATDSANWVLTNFPNAYLFKALKHAAIFFKDIQGATGYDVLARQITDEIMRVNGRNNRAVLTVDPALIAGSGGLSLARFNAGDF